MSDHYIPTSEAWRRVAEMLFPDKPVMSRITDLDAMLIDSYHPPHDMHYSDLGAGHKTFAPNELIAQVYRAYSRLLRRDRVYQWFEERDFDLGQPTISKHLFEAAVQAEFGQPLPEPTKPIEKASAKVKPRKPKSKHGENIVGSDLIEQPRTHARFVTDDALVAEAIDGLKSKKYPNKWKAAQALAPRAEGSDRAPPGGYPAKVFRLNTKIGNALKTPQNIPPQNISKHRKTNKKT